MQRDRISKYSWSVRGFLPGRQRLRCSFANEHSQGARWLMLSSGHNLYHVASAPSSRLQLSSMDDSARDSNGGAGVGYANRADTHLIVHPASPALYGPPS